MISIRRQQNNMHRSKAKMYIFYSPRESRDRPNRLNLLWPPAPLNIKYSSIHIYFCVDDKGNAPKKTAKRIFACNELQNSHIYIYIYICFYLFCIFLSSAWYVWWMLIGWKIFYAVFLINLLTVCTAHISCLVNGEIINFNSLPFTWNVCVYFSFLFLTNCCNCKQQQQQQQQNSTV